MSNFMISAYSELDAVNNIIGTIGESPVNTLENLTDVDAINALSILRSVNRQEQARGWSFNTIDHYTLNPNADTHTIPWSEDYLFLKDNNGHKLIKAGDLVKDLTRNSTSFKEPLDVEAILYVSYENMPEAMRNYIVAKACFIFQNRFFGDDTLLKVTQMQMQETWQQLQEYEISNNDYNMLNLTGVAELRCR